MKPLQKRILITKLVADTHERLARTEVFKSFHKNRIVASHWSLGWFWGQIAGCCNELWRNYYAWGGGRASEDSWKTRSQGSCRKGCWNEISRGEGLGSSCVVISSDQALEVSLVKSSTPCEWGCYATFRHHRFSYQGDLHLRGIISCRYLVLYLESQQ